MLCYDSCNTRWYGDTSTMTCLPCRYDCYTCTNASGCATCNSTTDYRYLNGTSCRAVDGYYDDGSNATVASQCTSPCATCQTTATYCLSCISGYYLQSHTCISCGLAITDCLTCNSSSYCTLCASGASGASCTSCTST